MAIKSLLEGRAVEAQVAKSIGDNLGLKFEGVLPSGDAYVRQVQYSFPRDKDGLPITFFVKMGEDGSLPSETAIRQALAAKRESFGMSPTIPLPESTSSALKTDVQEFNNAAKRANEQAQGGAIPDVSSLSGFLKDFQNRKAVSEAEAGLFERGANDILDGLSSNSWVKDGYYKRIVSVEGGPQVQVRYSEGGGIDFLVKADDGRWSTHVGDVTSPSEGKNALSSAFKTMDSVMNAVKELRGYGVDTSKVTYITSSKARQRLYDSALRRSGYVPEGQSANGQFTWIKKGTDAGGDLTLSAKQLAANYRANLEQKGYHNAKHPIETARLNAQFGTGEQGKLSALTHDLDPYLNPAADNLPMIDYLKSKGLGSRGPDTPASLARTDAMLELYEKVGQTSDWAKFDPTGEIKGMIEGLGINPNNVARTRAEIAFTDFPFTQTSLDRLRTNIQRLPVGEQLVAWENGYKLAIADMASGFAGSPEAYVGTLANQNSKLAGLARELGGTSESWGQGTYGFFIGMMEERLVPLQKLNVELFGAAAKDIPTAAELMVRSLPRDTLARINANLEGAHEYTTLLRDGATPGEARQTWINKYNEQIDIYYQKLSAPISVGDKGIIQTNGNMLNVPVEENQHPVYIGGMSSVLRGFELSPKGEILAYDSGEGSAMILSQVDGTIRDVVVPSSTSPEALLNLKSSLESYNLEIFRRHPEIQRFPIEVRIGGLIDI